ncbi:hypothetical protein HDU67_008678 [Dinochytrium kinnereticum]|nr:hypothetical protein HDU67_008678 [Dinochytrium kinnereticum]
MARGKQSRGKQGKMARGKQSRGKKGKMVRGKLSRGKQGKMSRGKQSKMSRGRTPTRGRSSQGKTAKGKMSRGKTPARGKMSQGKKSSRGKTSRGKRYASRGKTTQSRVTSKRSRGGNGLARSRPSSRGGRSKGSRKASGRRGTSSTRSRAGKRMKGKTSSGKKSQPETVCLARRSRVSRSGGCVSARRSSRGASKEATKKIRKAARPNEVAKYRVDDRKRRPKPSQEETQAMKDREAELRKHGGDEYKDIHAVVLDREKMPTHGVNADKLFQRLDNDPVARDGMDVKKVVKDENDKILGVVATVPYYESKRSDNFASERGKKAKDRQNALHNQLAAEKGLTRSQWFHHFGSQSTVVDEALPVSLGGNTHNNFALVPQPESAQQGGAMGSHSRVIQPGDNVFFSYSGDATPQHHQMYKDLKDKAKDAMASQNTAADDGRYSVEDGIQAMEISRRDLNEVEAKDVGDAGRFVGQGGKEDERVLKVWVGPVDEISKGMAGATFETNGMKISVENVQENDSESVRKGAAAVSSIIDSQKDVEPPTMNKANKSYPEASKGVSRG